MAYEKGVLNLPADHPRLSRLLAAGLGVLTTLTFAPFGWGLIAPLLLLPLLYVALHRPPRDTGWHFFCFGLGLFLSGTYWIQISVAGFGGAPWWVALVLMVGLALIMSAWLWLAGWLTSSLSHGGRWSLLLAAPASWVLIEWLRGWVASGFPWLAFGYGQIDTWMAGWAPVLGVYGASFFVVLSGAALLLAVLLTDTGRWIAAGIALLPWLLGVWLYSIEWTGTAGPAFQSTLVQGGVSQDRKWLPEQREPTMRFYVQQTLAAADSELVVWPEVAVPSLIDQVEPYIEGLSGISQRNEQTIAFGILERRPAAGRPRIYNTVVALDGERRQIYRKRHLVPYGEYFPVPQFVRDWMQSMNLPYQDLSPGDAVQPLITAANGVQIAVGICYEDAYAAEFLYAFPEAGLFINVSNDAWFGDSIAAHQHLEIARMRSLEFGRPTIRATNTGISAFIGHRGEILKTGPQHQPVTLTASLKARNGATPYANWGNVPIIAACLLLLAIGWLRTPR